MIFIYTARAECYTKGLTNLNSEFFLSQIGFRISVKEPSLPYYLLITRRSRLRFIPSQRYLRLCKIQTALSRI